MIFFGLCITFAAGVGLASLGTAAKVADAYEAGYQQGYLDTIHSGGCGGKPVANHDDELNCYTSPLSQYTGSEK